MGWSRETSQYRTPSQRREDARAAAMMWARAAKQKELLARLGERLRGPLLHVRPELARMVVVQRWGRPKA